MFNWLKQRWEAWMGYLYIVHHSKIRLKAKHTPCKTCKYAENLGYSSAACHYMNGRLPDARKHHSPDNGISCLSHSMHRRKGFVRWLWSIIW